MKVLEEYFKVNVDKYVKDKKFDVVRPASLTIPKDNAVMFINVDRIEQASVFVKCSNCLVFWPEDIEVPKQISSKHAIFPCKDPHKEYCRFFYNNKISYLPPMEDFEIVKGAYICKTAKIGENCRILPGCYIGGEVEIGDNCYIGSGTRLVGKIRIGNNVEIRENSVIGADGLSTDRDENSKALTMPQFGGVIIEDDVKIGALTVIARGAIDNTVLKRGVKIDNSVFISHNVIIGENTFVVGESIMFGSSSTGSQVFISGNSAIRNGRHIGDRAIVGMGSVVVKDIEDGAVVKGNPAK